MSAGAHLDNLISRLSDRVIMHYNHQQSANRYHAQRTDTLNKRLDIIEKRNRPRRQKLARITK